MKRIIIALLLTVIAGTAVAGDEKNIVPAPLRSATVYRAGAELQHTAKAVLTQGNNELILDGISNNIDLNSLQIGAADGISILSMEFSTNFLKPEQKSAVTLRLEDSLEIVDRELAKVQVLIHTNMEMLDLLKANKQIAGSQNGLSVTELIKMMDYYKTKTLELQNELSVYKDKETKLLGLTSKINQQIKEEEKKNIKTTGKLALQLFCPASGNYTFTITYVTPTAYWKPAYDIRVDDISKPVSLSYKAKLVQTTGIDWKQVKLALSTSVPSQHNNAPVFKSWFLAYANPMNRLDNAMLSKQNSIQSYKSASLDEVVIVGLSGRTAGLSVGDSDAREQEKQTLYLVNGQEVSRAEYNKIDKRAIKEVTILKDAQAAALYGSRASGGAIVATLKDGLGDYVSVDDNELNVTFNIDLPYDVPTNGKEQNVVLKEFKVPSYYKYYCAPKLDKDAYLLSEIADWENLNLLPGEANIIFEGTYIGKTFIDPNSTQDTMNLTLGRDKRVVVKREKMVDFSSAKFIGSNKKQTFTYEITVKNNKKEKIEMLLKDQYPLSTNKDIEVELLQSDGAVVNDEIGVLTWKLELAPGEVKKVRVSYSAKFPKDRVVNIN
jgi:TonB-dependent SusC/RagA subfamily outer membrane receptor